MVRPRYETQADLEREAAVIGALTRRITGAEAFKMEQGARADYRLVVNGSDVAYVEIKTRTCTSRTYATYHVSKDKLVSLRRLAEKNGVKPLLLVKWKDRIGVIGVDTYLDNATFAQGGRKDRNDPFDIEEMAEVRIEKFTFI